MTENPTPPNWPDDVLYLPVSPGSKAPDTEELPGTWSYDGVGCVSHDDLTDRRWGIVDVDVEGYRLLIVDLDIYKLDDDDEHKQTLLDGLENAPETRIHATQSGGLHVFYWLKEEELTESGKLPVKLASEVDDKLNGYVLSTHCEGYEVETDTEPTEITVEDIPDEWIDKERATTTDRDEGGNFVGSSPEHDDFSDLSVYDILQRSRFPDGERVAHPHHGSETGANFMVDPGGETWRCWRHDVTGNALHLLGIQEGIISCGDWETRSLSTSKWESILEAAEDEGLIEPTSIAPEEQEEKAGELDDTDEYEAIELVDFPDSQNFVLDKPPREGGSYGLFQYFLGQQDDPLLVLAPRHAILDYHLETVADMLPREECVVHYEGSHRTCDNPENCPNRPESLEQRNQFEDEVIDILYRKQSVTADDAPEHICPYWFIKEASKKAHVVVTVPNLFPNITDLRDTSEMNLMMDEEQTIYFFWPGSATLTDIVSGIETDGTRTITQQKKNISSLSRTLDDILDDIHEEQERRKEKAEKEGRDWRRKSGERIIEEAAETVDEIKEKLGTSSALEELRESNEQVSLPSVIHHLNERLQEVEFPDRTADPDTYFEAITEWCAPYFWDDESNPDGLLESLIFPYEENTFYFKRKQRDRYTLRLIGDRERRPFYGDELENFNQIGAIAGPEGQRFLDELDGEAKTIRITDFRYADNFVILPVGKVKDDELEPVGEQRDRVAEITETLNRNQIPHIAVAGTKEQANSLSADLTSGTSDVVGDPAVPAITLYQLWSEGHTAIIYANSIVSRGIDVPFFDITTVSSPGFAVPYWEAKKFHYKGEDRDEYLNALATEKELKSRELTNAAVRMAPTREVESFYGTKFIVMAQSDLTKLKYIRDRDLTRFAREEPVVTLLKNLTVRGESQITLADTYRALGKSEKEFIQVASVEEFTETKRDRPDYDMEELNTWLENRYITSERPFDAVLETIKRSSDPPFTEEISDSLSALSRGKVTTVLSILERKGVVRSQTEDNTGAGRPAKNWRLT